jgi:hypothetical protein
MAPKNSTASLAQRFNSRGYRTYWQKYGVFSVGSAGNRRMRKAVLLSVLKDGNNQTKSKKGEIRKRRNGEKEQDE